MENQARKNGRNIVVYEKKELESEEEGGGGVSSGNSNCSSDGSEELHGPAVIAEPLGTNMTPVPSPSPSPILGGSPRASSQIGMGRPRQTLQQQQQLPVVSIRERRVANAESKTVNIMDSLWKVRSCRDHHEPSHDDSRSFLRRLMSAILSDISFALGSFKGGGLIGPPHSVQQIYNSKVEIVPTQSPSEGFESSCRSGEVELDSSLQLISNRMKEILTRIEGRCRMSAVRLLGWMLSKLWQLTFTKVEVDTVGVTRIRRDLELAAREGKAVMLLPTHRSHVDYLLMSYVCFGFNLPVPHIAAGDNLNIPIIGPLFSYSGAFFLRRSFKGDNLYKKVLYSYLLRKLREGCPVEVFVEGGRSRTGMISEPKVGMIVMALRFVREGSLPDVMLLPSTIDYDRVLESDSHVGQQLGSKKKKESFLGTIRSGVRVLTGASTHGSVFVNFADGISIKEVMEKVENPLRDSAAASSSSASSLSFIPEEVFVNAVAQAVVRGQREVSYATPVGLVAAGMLGTASGEESELAHKIRFLVNLARRAGMNLPNHLRVEDEDFLTSMIGEARVVLDPLLRRGGRTCSLEDRARTRLRLKYSCGQLVPCLAPMGVIATVLQALENGSNGVRVEQLLRSAGIVADMVRYGIPGSLLDSLNLQEALDILVEIGAVYELESNGKIYAASHDAAGHLRALRILVAPSVQAFCGVTNAALSLMQSSNFTQDDLIEHSRNILHAQANGEGTDWAKQQKKHLIGENSLVCLGSIVGLPEAISLVEIKSAIKALTAVGILRTANGFSGSGSSGKLYSNASFVSFTSARSIATEDERKSSGSSETQSTAEGLSEIQHNLLEIAPSFRKRDGSRLLERLSLLQRFLYREKRIPSDMKQAMDEIYNKNMRAQGRKHYFSHIGIAILSGMLLPLFRAYRKRSPPKLL